MSGHATMAKLERQLEEINLLKCSLLQVQGEELTFIVPSGELDHWGTLLEAFPDPHVDYQDESLYPSSAARFQVKADESRIWFEVQLPQEYPGENLASDAILSMISVRGSELNRSEQERWHEVMKENLAELADSEYPIYELISTHILPLLHSEASIAKASELITPVVPVAEQNPKRESSQLWHALLTSHHLISPTKRRNLQQWSSQLSITGFAKVGYPGVIYAEGAQIHVKEFVDRVKAMQWLALRVRFAEEIPQQFEINEKEQGLRRWVEFEKVGEVVQEMRSIGRESFVVEMGIGSAGT